MEKSNKKLKITTLKYRTGCLYRGINFGNASSEDIIICKREKYYMEQTNRSSFQLLQIIPLLFRFSWKYIR
jgi:hypothetical protein